MARLVKCKYCGDSIDRDKVKWAKVGTRYVHASCLQEREQSLKVRKEEEEIERRENMSQYKEVLDFARDNINNPNYSLIQRQMRDYLDNKGYTYSGIYKTLIYCKNIAKLNFANGNGGIGIVPYYYDKAKTYYYQMFITNKQNEEKNKVSETVEVKVQLEDVRTRRPHRGFNFLNEGVQNGK